MSLAKLSKLSEALSAARQDCRPGDDASYERLITALASSARAASQIRQKKSHDVVKSGLVPEMGAVLSWTVSNPASLGAATSRTRDELIGAAAAAFNACTLEGDPAAGSSQMLRDPELDQQVRRIKIQLNSHARRDAW